MANNFTRTAPSSTSDKDEDESKEEYDEELDFASPKFNPLRVLQSEKVSVPYPNAKVLSSVSGFQEQPLQRQLSSLDLLPVPQSQQLHSSHQPTQRSSVAAVPGSSAVFKPRETASERRRRRLRQEKRKEEELRLQQQQKGETEKATPDHALLQRERITAATEGLSATPGKNRRQKNVFTRMKSMTGPLSFLTRCMEQRLHVRVMVRGAVTVRGICRGYIVAFDKHFNMAMVDVDEIYRRPAALGKVKSRRGDKLRAAQDTLQNENKQMKSALKGKCKTSNETAVTTVEASDTGDIDHEKLKETLPKVNMEALYGILSSVTNTNESAQQEAGKKDSVHTLPLQRSSRESSQNRHGDSDQNRPEAGAVSLPRKNKKLLTSVYKGVSLPCSPFEREALMLGISDENLQFRHVNQLFVRGENVVTVCLVNFEEG